MSSPSMAFLVVQGTRQITNTHTQDQTKNQSAAQKMNIFIKDSLFSLMSFLKTPHSDNSMIIQVGPKNAQLRLSSLIQRLCGSWNFQYWIIWDCGKMVKWELNPIWAILGSLMGIQPVKWSNPIRHRLDSCKPLSTRVKCPLVNLVSNTPCVFHP